MLIPRQALSGGVKVWGSNLLPLRAQVFGKGAWLI